MFNQQLSEIIPLEELKLSRCALVNHYIGDVQPEYQLALLRYSRSDGKNNQLGGEHVSTVFDINTGKLMGLTRMLAGLDNESFVSHKTALTKAVEFLQCHATDLIKEITLPELIPLPTGSRIEFTPPLTLGNKIECHWIDTHQEMICLNNTTTSIHGMKVKIFIPEKKLWAWVIIDKYGKVETFERDICWDFDIMQRQTQMWLHDNWLLTNNPSHTLWTITNE